MIRKYYEPKFQKRSVSLHCPKIDHSMARRMKGRRGPELTKVEQKEKTLTSMQFKLLDIARPLVFISESLVADKTDANLDVHDVCSDSIRLLGHAFACITTKRRENILKFTDPRFESLLKEPERFDLDESDELFGRTFLRSMEQDADNDAKLRIVNRASNSGQRQSGHSGPSGSSHHHGREGGRHSANSNFPSGSNRGFNNNFSGKEYVNPSASLIGDFGYVGGRVRFSADFWPTLTSDQWVIRSVSEGVRISLISIPSVPFTQSNMGMSAELEAICDTEVQSLLQKKAIEIVPETELCFVEVEQLTCNCTIARGRVATEEQLGLYVNKREDLNLVGLPRPAQPNSLISLLYFGKRGGSFNRNYSGGSKQQSNRGNGFKTGKWNS
ncbi:hypothetical protein DAPPUDRAFT_320020 [Daphnia pulex]|uniref:Uncharacterized protein n=1 Tax=Daphnia pulex TaxID=6669 RepID=E9GNL3_DAPPU|nr:hypothetical protein DAPPUDRAFT_320020 [Daphnia pulex]|eukprot:EFX78943.1 hypothetical protein DAPPUDRAFT_320020 [Daphnia pulex]